MNPPTQGKDVVKYKAQASALRAKWAMLSATLGPTSAPQLLDEVDPSAYGTPYPSNSLSLSGGGTGSATPGGGGPAFQAQQYGSLSLTAPPGSVSFAPETSAGAFPEGNSGSVGGNSSMGSKKQRAKGRGMPAL